MNKQSRAGETISPDGCRKLETFLMPKRVTTRDLVGVLKQLGFDEAAKRGGHTLFQHRKKGAAVTVPTDRPYVPMVHFRTIERTMENYDIISRLELEKKLDVQIP
jgi:predicted RNA binding protein YcfA (HicA-like mRNA interferase family)